MRELLATGLQPKEVLERMRKDGHAVAIQLIYSVASQDRKKNRELRKLRKEARKAATPQSSAGRPSPVVKATVISTATVLTSVRQVLTIEAINEEEQLRLIRKIVG